MLLIAYFFTVIVSFSPCPLVIGPYLTASDCMSVREWLDRRGYDTGSCGLLPIPQDSVLLEVGYLPHELPDRQGERHD